MLCPDSWLLNEHLSLENQMWNLEEAKRTNSEPPDQKQGQSEKGSGPLTVAPAREGQRDAARSLET